MTSFVRYFDVLGVALILFVILAIFFYDRERVRKLEAQKQANVMEGKDE